MDEFLPSWATLSECEGWLRNATGEPWPLPRILKHGVWPSAWIDYSPDVPAAVFERGAEGPGDVADWLRDLLKDGPMAVREVKRHADDAGYSWRTTQRAMKRAGAQQQRAGFGKPAEWFLAAIRATVAPVAPSSERGASGATVLIGGATAGVADDMEVI